MLLYFLFNKDNRLNDTFIFCWNLIFSALRTTVTTVSYNLQLWVKLAIIFGLARSL